MLEKLSVAIAKRLCSNLSIADEQYEACCYGCETLLHTILSTLGLLIIGLCFHMVTETLIIVSVFYINQTLGGGFHATSHLKCFLTMTVFLLLSLLLCKLPQQQWIDAFLSIIALIILFLIPLVLHENKQYLSDRTLFFIKRSHIAVAAFACIVAILILSKSILIRPTATGLALSAVSRFYAKHSIKPPK